MNSIKGKIFKILFTERKSDKKWACAQKYLCLLKRKQAGPPTIWKIFNISLRILYAHLFACH